MYVEAKSCMEAWVAVKGSKINVYRVLTRREHDTVSQEMLLSATEGGLASRCGASPCMCCSHVAQTQGSRKPPRRHAKPSVTPATFHAI